MNDEFTTADYLACLCAGLTIVILLTSRPSQILKQREDLAWRTNGVTETVIINDTTNEVLVWPEKGDGK